MTEHVERANADGKPHLTYFDTEHNISFVWSGVYGEDIQVCPGGYGEPARWYQPTEYLHIQGIALVDRLEYFKTRCEQWFQLDRYCTSCGGELPKHKDKCWQRHAAV